MDNQNPNPTQPGSNSNNQPSSLPESPLSGGNSPQPTQPTPPPSYNPPPAAPQQPAQPDMSKIFADPTDTTTPSETGSAISGIAHGFSTIFGAIFSWVIFPIAVVLILHNFVFQAYHVIGTSMVPNLHDADYLIISKIGNTQSAIARAFGQNKPYIPARGEIVVFHFPKDPTRVFVKRVIGLPGDRVVVKNGAVTVYNAEHKDGFNPDTGYELKDTVTLIDTDEVVQPGNVFVMGDNRTPNGSYDSREWGELESTYIIGNAVLRLLPLDQAKTL